MDRQRVLIVDDHPLMRRALAELVADAVELDLCGEAADVGDAIALARRERPDVAMLDVSLPSGSGLELATQLLSINAELKILFVSMHDDAAFAERALKAGAFGYINKSQSSAEMLAALRKVARGELALSPSVADRLVRRGMGMAREPAGGVAGLSNRELEVFELIGRGLSTREIAERLNLSIKTVETHREHIKSKLSVSSAAELSRQATLWSTTQS